MDFVNANGELTFPAETTSTNIVLTIIDNEELDEDRTLRLRFTTVPDGRSLPPAEITIVNDELGFVPGSLRVFPNGTWTVRPTGHLDGARLDGIGIYLDTSSDFSDWVGGYWLDPFVPEPFFNEGYWSQRFMRLRRE